MTAAIFEKTWTVRASAAKAAQRAGLAKGSYIIAECNGEFAILELEKEAPAATIAETIAICTANAEAANEAYAPIYARTHAAPAATVAAPAFAAALPTPPDFSKPSHAPYRKRLAAMIAMAEAGDDVGLAALTFKVERSSQKIMARYRDACLKALGR